MSSDFERRLAAFRSNMMLTVKEDKPIQVDSPKNLMPVEDTPEVITMGNFIRLSNKVDEVWEYVKDAATILYVKPVQSGKTGQAYKLMAHMFKTHIIIMVSDKNKALAAQTNKRGMAFGWTIKDFSDGSDLMTIYTFLMKYGEQIRKGQGKKQIMHFLMEINNVNILMQLLVILPKDIPICLVIDEGDKNRNTVTDVSDDTDDVDDEEKAMPPITRGLLICKNQLFDKQNGSKTFYITATPQGVMCSEKDQHRKTVYQEPFNEYSGAGLNKSPDIELVNCMERQTCKARDRWTGDSEDTYNNTYYPGVVNAIQRLEKMGTKDSSVKQLMLVSLENRNAVQDRLAFFIKDTIQYAYKDSIGIIVFNGEVKNKDKEMPLLADKIRAMKQRKIIIISGFCAARGVSFTDFSDAENKFELVIQVHAAKRNDPLNSSLQAMRIYGPMRRSIQDDYQRGSRPILFCNSVTEQDNRHNFREMYRICQELAEGNKIIYSGQYDVKRKFVQDFCFRYMKQEGGYILLRESSDLEDHKRICTM